MPALPLRTLTAAGLLVLASCGGASTVDSPAADSSVALSGSTGSTDAPDTTADTSTGRSTCTERFPDLSGVEGAGDGYEKPQVKVTCADGTMTVTSNGMTGYEFVAKTPNGLRAQDYTWEITSDPQAADATTSIKQKLGPVAFTVTGLPIFGPMEGPIPAAEAYGDPVHNKLLDTCGGHTGYNADYHYHTIIAETACLLDETIVGYALDGFPIYSNPGQKQTSSWVRTGDPTSNAWDAYTFTKGSGTLDECNGTTGDDGSYRYYVTSSFPYVIGCYTGTAGAQTGAAAAAMGPMGGPVNGLPGPPPGGPPPPPGNQGGASGAAATAPGTVEYYCSLV